MQISFEDAVRRVVANDTAETLLSIPGVWEAVTEDPATHSEAMKVMESYNEAYRCSECHEFADEELEDGLCDKCETLELDRDILEENPHWCPDDDDTPCEPDCPHGNEDPTDTDDDYLATDWIGWEI